MGGLAALCLPGASPLPAGDLCRLPPSHLSLSLRCADGEDMAMGIMGDQMVPAGRHQGRLCVLLFPALPVTIPHRWPEPTMGHVFV